MTDLTKPNSKTSELQIASQPSTQIADAIKSKELTFYAVKKAGDMKTLEYEIIKKILHFLKVNFMQSKNPDFANTAMQFAADIIISEPTWKITDIDALLTFVRTRRDILDDKYLKEVNSIKLMEWAFLYNMEKADARAEYNRSRYNTERDKFKQSAKIKEYVKRVLKTIDDATPKKEYTHKPQKLFDPVIYSDDYNIFIKLIPDLTKEEKEKFRLSVYNYESIIQPEMDRREKLLELLK